MTVDARWVEQAAARTAKRTGVRQIIEADWPCPKCKYNLKGLPKPGACPECGTKYGQSPIDPSVDALNVERPSAAQLRILAMSVGALVAGGALLLTGLLAPIAMAMLPPLSPKPESHLWLAVLAAAGVFAVPGAVVWLIGAWMLTLSAPVPGADPSIANPRTLDARPLWQVWTTRACAPGFLVGTLAMIVALFPGMGEHADLFAIIAKLGFAIGSLGTLPLIPLLVDLCKRVEFPDPEFRLSLGLWAIPAGGAGLALATVLPDWLGWPGSIIGGLGWMCGWFLVPMCVVCLWAIWPLRGTLAWAHGVASALEASPAKPARPAAHTTTATRSTR